MYSKFNDSFDINNESIKLEKRVKQIIKHFNNWKILNLTCIKKSPADVKLYKKSDLLEKRLKEEYVGYLKPLKQNFNHYPKKRLDSIYSKIQGIYMKNSFYMYFFTTTTITTNTAERVWWCYFVGSVVDCFYKVK